GLSRDGEALTQRQERVPQLGQLGVQRGPHLGEADDLRGRGWFPANARCAAIITAAPMAAPTPPRKPSRFPPPAALPVRARLPLALPRRPAARREKSARPRHFSSSRVG